MHKVSNSAFSLLIWSLFWGLYVLLEPQIQQVLSISCSISVMTGSLVWWTGPSTWVAVFIRRRAVAGYWDRTSRSAHPGRMTITNISFVTTPSERKNQQLFIVLFVYFSLSLTSIWSKYCPATDVRIYVSMWIYYSQDGVVILGCWYLQVTLDAQQTDNMDYIKVCI